MSAAGPRPVSAYALVIVSAVALVYAIALFAFFSGGTRTLASWTGRCGSIAVIAGALLQARQLLANGGEPDESRIAQFSQYLMTAGSAAIVAGFVLGTAGF